MSALYTKLCTALQENNEKQIREIIVELNNLNNFDQIRELQIILHEQSSNFLNELARCKLPENQKNDLLFAAKRIKSYSLTASILTKRKSEEEINDRPSKKITTEKIDLEKVLRAYEYTNSQIENFKKLQLLDAIRDFHTSVKPLPGCEIIFLTAVNGGKEDLLNLKDNINQLKILGFHSSEIEELIKNNEYISKLDYVLKNWKTVQESKLSNFEIIRAVKNANSIKSLQGIIEYLPKLRAINCTKPFVSEIIQETQGNKLKSTYEEIEANNKVTQSTTTETKPTRLTYAAVRTLFNPQMHNQHSSPAHKKDVQKRPPISTANSSPPPQVMKNVYQLTNRGLSQESSEMKSSSNSEFDCQNLAYSG